MAITRRAALALMTAPAFAQGRPRVAITMDDVRWQQIPETGRGEAEARILDAVGKTRAFLFAIGGGVDNPHGADILTRWSVAGHWVGNHTWNHLPLLGKMTPAEFETDILRTDSLLRGYSGFRKCFRFPLLKEGRTREERDRLRSFLAQQGYRN